MRIDAHQHFWKYEADTHAWITEDMSVLRRDYGPDDLMPQLQQCGIDGCVAVQADQSEAETLYLLDLARAYPFIKGVVGWVDLQSDDIEPWLAHFQQFPQLKGFRHIIQAESDPDFFARPAFQRGVTALRHYDFTYDILIYHHQLPAALQFAKRFDQQSFIIDHLAKPAIKTNEIADWQQQIQQFEPLEHVYCKLSGLITEADWNNWTYDQLLPYLETVLETFGPQRIAFGSDWPVCLLAGSYSQVYDIVLQFVNSLSSDEQTDIMGRTAVGFYGL